MTQLELLEFSAKWCPPCKAQKPIMERVERELKVPVRYIDVDTREGGELASQYEVWAVPTMILLKDGREVHRWVGFTPYEELAQAIAREKAR